MHRILRNIQEGKGRASDLDLLLDIMGQIEGGRTICALADGTAWPLRAFVTKYREEFEAYIERGGPPPGATVSTS